MARHPEHLSSRLPDGAEAVQGDVFDCASLDQALQRVDTAYYLIHSLGAGAQFEERDREGAKNFAEAARDRGVRRIVYLGALGDSEAALSAHLRSRQETGHVLRSTGVPVTEFRAAVILGSGGMSFELIRALVERLPVMICPRWVHTPTQPIGIDDLLAYLVAAADQAGDENRIYEIGGSEVSSYGAVMREYARQRGLRRFLISVPFLTPRLSSLWLGLVTPVYARVGRSLVEGLRNPTVVQDSSALRDFAVKPAGVAESLRRALRNEDRECAETCWTDALSSSAASPSYGGERLGSRLVETHVAQVPLPVSAAFAPIRRIGGAKGWYFGDWLWRLRGLVDLAAGGPGVRRGRRHPETPEVGSHIDFWRVEAYERDHLLRLRAEMRLPGRAWLQFEVVPAGSGSEIRQSAMFDPLGLAGLFYWYALYPLHGVIFRKMLRNIVKETRLVLPGPARGGSIEA